MILFSLAGYLGGGANTAAGISRGVNPRASALKLSWPRPRPRDMMEGGEEMRETR